MKLYYENCRACGKTNRFRACNNYTPVRMRKKCMKCRYEMVVDIEKKVELTWADIDYKMENKIAARAVSRGRRVSAYMGR